MALTSGRSSMACATRPAPAPIAAEHHSIAAVFRPQMFMPPFMITPAPRQSDAGRHVGHHPHCAFGSVRAIVPLGPDRRAQHARDTQADKAVQHVRQLEGAMKGSGKWLREIRR
jgi:hypothetical protein